MAEKQVNLAQGFGTDEYAKYQAASRTMENLLAQRENRLFDPTLLAMAQGFLAPTKTGSFGESLGNVAGAVAPVQQAEDKRILDMAKMRLDMAERGVKTSIGLKQQENINADIARNTVGYVPPATAPAAPPAAQGTQAAGASVAPPAIGSAPTAPPAVGGALPSAGGALPSAPAAPTATAPAQGPLSTMVQAPQAQQATQEPTASNILGGIPLGIPASSGSMNLSPAEANMVRLGIQGGKTLPDMYKYVAERRNDETVWKEGFGVHRPTNTFIPAPSSEQVEIQLPGDNAPRKVFKSDSMALQHYARTNDPRYNEVLDLIKNGPQVARKPAVPTGTQPGTAPPPQVGIPTTADVAANKARLEAEAKEEGTGSGKRTSTAKDQVSQAIESRNTALSVKDLIAQPNMDLAVGVFEKPKVKEAILGMVNDAVFSEEKFRDAYTKTNIKFNIPQRRDEKREEYEQRKQDVYDRAAQVASQAAYLQFQVSMLAKGQGAISNMERQMFANTTIGVRDTVATMNKKADMIIARADFAQNIADRLTDGVTIDQFRKTPEYKKMEKDYENKLRNIWNPTRSQTQSSSAPLTAEQLKAARDRVNGVLP
jgi:hypothetical protein